MMFGYACDETPRADAPGYLLEPQVGPSSWPRSARRGTLSYLRPDGKTQVTVEYDGDTVKRVDAIVISPPSTTRTWTWPS